MTILRTPVMLAPPLPDLAEVQPLRLGPEIAREISLPIGNSQPVGSEAKATGRFIRGNNSGSMLTLPERGYETCQHGAASIHSTNWSYQAITFTERVRAWILISDTEVFDDNWKLYFPDETVFYILSSGKYWMFDFPIKSTLIARNMANYSTTFEWYGIY